MECITSLPILFISSYGNTTVMFTVPSGGDGVYYFSTYLIYFQLWQHKSNVHSSLWWRWSVLLLYLSYLFPPSYDSTTGVFTVPPGGDGVYYFSLFLIYLFPVMTTQQECSQCPLVEMGCTTSLFISWVMMVKVPFLTCTSIMTSSVQHIWTTTVLVVTLFQDPTALLWSVAAGNVYI